MENWRVYNIDCLIGIKKYLENDSVDLIFTDPPYGIKGEDLDKHYNRDDTKVIPGYVDVPFSEYAEWCKKWINECERVLRPGGSFYVVSGYTNLHHILNALHSTSLKEINHLIAQYSFGVYTKNKFVSSHYHMLFWSKPESKTQKRTFNSRFPDTRKSYIDRSSVQNLPREYKKGKIKNANQISESFIKKFIEYSSNINDLVFDPFGGSFSTGRAALSLNRKFIGFEINPVAYKHFEKII